MEKQSSFVKGENNRKENTSLKIKNMLQVGLLTLATISPFAHTASAEKQDFEVPHPLRKINSAQSINQEPQQPTFVIPQKEQEKAFDPLTKEGMMSTFMPRYRAMSEEQKKKVNAQFVQNQNVKTFFLYGPFGDNIRWERPTTLQGDNKWHHFLVAYGEKTFMWEIHDFNDKKSFTAKCVYWKNNQPILVLRSGPGYNPHFGLNDFEKICPGAPELKHQIAWDNKYGLILIDEQSSIVGQYDLEDDSIKDIREDRKKANLDQYDKEQLRLTPEGNAYLVPDDPEYNQRLMLRMETSYFDNNNTSFYIRPRLLKQPIPLSQIRVYDTQPPTDLMPLDKKETVAKTSDEITNAPKFNAESPSYQRVQKTLASLVKKGVVNEIDVKQYIETGNETGIHSFTILKNAQNEPALVLILGGKYGLSRNYVSTNDHMTSENERGLVGIVEEAVYRINVIDPDLIKFLTEQYNFRAIAGGGVFKELSPSSDPYYDLGVFDPKTGLLAINEEKNYTSTILLPATQFLYTMLSLIAEPYKTTKEGREHIDIIKWLKDNKEAVKKMNKWTDDWYKLFLQEQETYQKNYFSNQSAKTM